MQPAFSDRVSERNVSGAAGGGGAPGTAEVIVASEAIASGLVGLADGQQVFIKSHRSWWRFNANSTAPLRAHSVIASASAGVSPRLLRTTYAAPEWRDENTDVYIDPSNASGVANDENQAFFNAAQIGNARQPLLTWQEFFRRLGSGNPLNAGLVAGLGFKFLTVHVLSSEPGGTIAADPATIDTLLTVDSFMQIQGEAATVALAGNLDGAGGFTAQNPAVPAPGGTPCSIKVGATVWGPFIGKRIRFTASGAVATILKDLGGGSARISQPQTTGAALFNSVPTNVNPPNGAAFVVEDLTTINPGYHWKFRGEGSPAFAFPNQVNVLDLTVALTQAGGDFPFAPDVADAMLLVFYQCGFDRAVQQGSSIVLNGCTCRSTFASNGAGFGGIYGGAIVAAAAFPLCAEIVGASQAFFNSGAIDFNTYLQGGCVIFRDGGAVAGVFSVWDAAVQANFNPGGHAVNVGGAPNLSAGSGVLALRSGNVIFGSGSTGKGVRVAPGSKISQYLALPNITGATGDLQLADSVIGLWGDFATGTYQPPGGIALSWAALAAAAGPAGFGGSAHNHNQDAHVNKAAAS